MFFNKFVIKWQTALRNVLFMFFFRCCFYSFRCYFYCYWIFQSNACFKFHKQLHFHVVLLKFLFLFWNYYFILYELCPVPVPWLPNLHNICCSSFRSSWFDPSRGLFVLYISTGMFYDCSIFCVVCDVGESKLNRIINCSLSVLICLAGLTDISKTWISIIMHIVSKRIIWMDEMIVIHMFR